MTTIEEIKHTLEQLPVDERELVANWLLELNKSRRSRVEEPRPAYAAVQTLFMTVDEYLELEEKSPVRHEYVNGVVHAMSGPSVAHARITRELLAAVRSHLRRGPCEPFATDLKLFIRSDTDEIYYCPDLMVACRREDWGPNYIRNPKLIAEVLSPSTNFIDLREKAMAYRRIASVEEYVLLEQNEYKVIVQRREESWRPHEYLGPEAAAQLRSLGLSVPLAQIYEGTL